MLFALDNRLLAGAHADIKNIILKVMRELKDELMKRPNERVSKESLNEIVKVLVMHAIEKSIKKGFGEEPHLKNDYEDKLASSIIKNVIFNTF